MVNSGYTGATMNIVIDTSVLVAALRSRQGASQLLLRRLPSPLFRPALSVALYMEWQAVLMRAEHWPAGVDGEHIQGFLRYLASLSHLQDIHYLWRPFLRDPNDDMVLECAIASGSRYIVTHNVRDFLRSAELGVIAVTPGHFLHHLETLS
jgi:putative PIN family toxin of toxin-antitoxin system